MCAPVTVQGLGLLTGTAARDKRIWLEPLMSTLTLMTHVSLLLHTLPHFEQGSVAHQAILKPSSNDTHIFPSWIFIRISDRTCSVNHGVGRSARLVLCPSIIVPRRGSNAGYNRGITRLELQDSHYIKKNRSGQYPVWLSIATINFLLEILAPGIPHLSNSAHFNAIDLSTSERPQYFKFWLGNKIIIIMRK